MIDIGVMERIWEMTAWCLGCDGMGWMTEFVDLR
jgi:hypothetical protein